MKLRDYLKEEGIKIGVFSQKIGVTPYTLNCVLNSTRETTLSLACMIEDLTGGKVKCRDLLNPLYLQKHREKAKELKQRNLKKEKEC